MVLPIGGGLHANLLQPVTSPKLNKMQWVLRILVGLQILLALARIICLNVTGFVLELFMVVAGILTARRIVPFFLAMYGLSCALELIMSSVFLIYRVSKTNGEIWKDNSDQWQFNMLTVCTFVAPALYCCLTVLLVLMWRQCKALMASGEAAPLVHNTHHAGEHHTFWQRASAFEPPPPAPAVAMPARPAGFQPFQGQGYQLGADGVLIGTTQEGDGDPTKT
eukprot:Platyproteum_vivax@DN1087_c0_g1_i1.p1